MNSLILKFIFSFLLIIVVVFSFSATAQESLKFTDKFGNDFFFNSEILIPKHLTVDFLKANLNGSHFIRDIEKTGINYTFNIYEVERINRTNYRLRIAANPKRGGIAEILKLLGYSNYKLKISMNKKVIKFESIEFMYGEI